MRRYIVFAVAKRDAHGRWAVADNTSPLQVDPHKDVREQMERACMLARMGTPCPFRTFENKGTVSSVLFESRALLVFVAAYDVHTEVNFTHCGPADILPQTFRTFRPAKR